MEIVNMEIHDSQRDLISRSSNHSWAFLVIISVVSALGGFLFGYDTGVISGAMIQLREYFSLSYVYQEMIVSTSLLAAATACVVSAFLSDRVGRKTVILVASIIFTIGAVVMGASYNKICLLAGRLIVGLGIGIASMSVPVYIAEIAPNHMRGALVTLNTVFITAGQVVAAVVDALFISNEVNGWRYMLGIGGIPSFIQSLAFMTMPESPRWLVQRGQISKARVTLQRIYGVSTVTPQIEDEIREMIEASSTVQTPGTSQISSAVDYDVDHRDLKESSSSSGSGNTKLSGNVLYKCDDQTTSVSVAPRFQSINFWSRLTLFRMLRSKPTRRALFIGCGLQIFQQFVGINTVMYYGAEILSMAGIGGIGSKKEGNVKIAWLTALVAFVNFFFSLSAPWIVGRFKRRLIFYCSLSGVFLSLIILGISFQLITSYSTPVSVIEPIPMGIVDENTYTSCLKTKTCDVCIQQKHCGFCYQTYLSEQTKVPVNGSCLPSPTEFSAFSPYGRCTEMSMQKENTIWAFDHCPNPFGWMTLIGLILYLASFAPGMSPLPWTINAEIYPAWGRSTGVATATACNWIANLIVSLTFLSLTSVITRQGTYFLYAGISLLAIMFVWRFVPEHGNKTLEEIQIITQQS